MKTSEFTNKPILNAIKKELKNWNRDLMLKKKMIRDILNYKVQFLSIFLMAFIGVFVFTGMLAETNSLETTIDNYYEDSNLADGWIYSNYLSFDEFVEQVDLLGATTQMERQLVVPSQAKLENNPDITLHFVENNTISKFYLIEGDPLDINDSEGVWLDKKFAEARNLSIGDTIAFESNGIVIEKEIIGLGDSPEYIYRATASSAVPNYTSSGFAYLSHKAFPSQDIPYNVLNVKFKGTPETYSELLSYRLDGYYTAYLPQYYQYSANVVSDAISQQTSLSFVFPPLFIMLSMLMLLTTMKRIITHQRTQIGVLKANGFTDRKITMHYLLSGFILVTLGSTLGLILGPMFIHMITFQSRSFYFTFPYWSATGFLKFISIIIFMGAISLIVSYTSIKDIINEPPSIIIKPKAPKLITSNAFEKMKIWKKLPFNVRWNYRDSKRNKFRSAMTIIGVIGCTVLLINGFGIYEQINISKDWYFNDINNFESKLIIDDIGIDQIDTIVKDVDGEKIMDTSIEISTNETQLGSLLVFEGKDLIKITDGNRKKIELGSDEVSISQKMADSLGVKVGDTVEFHIVGSDKSAKVKIDKIHASPFSQGLVMSTDKLEKLGLNYTPTSIVTAQHVNKSYDGIKSILYSEDLIEGWDAMQKTSIQIITAMLVFAIVLAIVILYNMNLMSFIESEKDIATLKVLGFKSKYLTKLLATQSLFFIIIGFILGIPIGYYILKVLLFGFGKKFYFVPNISIANIVFTFAIIISVSIVMNLFFLRKIRTMDMVDSLKDLNS